MEVETKDKRIDIEFKSFKFQGHDQRNYDPLADPEAKCGPHGECD